MVALFSSNTAFTGTSFGVISAMHRERRQEIRNRAFGKKHHPTQLAALRNLFHFLQTA
jgi:hypothetical protein